MSLKINLEFGHIYTNESASGEHARAARIIGKLFKSSRSAPYVTSVLIDDYNVVEHLLDVEGYLNELGSYGAPVHYYAMESDLCKYFRNALSLMSPKEASKHERYVSKGKRIPCSVLTMIWYLLRLGHFKDDSIVKPFSPTNKAFAGNKLINLLSARYLTVEKNTNKLLSRLELATDFSEQVQNFYMY